MAFDLSWKDNSFPIKVWSQGLIIPANHNVLFVRGFTWKDGDVGEPDRDGGCPTPNRLSAAGLFASKW